jgi:ubiquitin C-terminal hydrolase
MEINLQYCEDYFSSDNKMYNISKYDKMLLLEEKRYKIEEEYKNKIKDIEQEINIELNDHKHQYKTSFNIPPYNYGKVCIICGHTIT